MRRMAPGPRWMPDLEGAALATRRRLKMATRVWKNCFSPCLYRNRNAIERMFGRLKDFRRIATRYGRLARNFHAAVRIAAVICYRL